jgi:hypothetical protein
MDLTKAIQAIEGKIESLALLRETKQFNVWQKETTLTLINIYSENDKRIKSLEAIHSYHDYGFAGLDRFSEAKSEAEALLKSLINDIKDFGIVKSDLKSKSNGINVNLNQHNTQSQTTNVSVNFELIIESLKYGLSGVQIEELKEILESKQEPKEKKKSFIEKIKSFGNDVASNILANLLTNPQVYEQLGGML